MAERTSSFAGKQVHLSAAFLDRADQGADGAACQLQGLTGALQHYLAAER